MKTFPEIINLLSTELQNSIRAINSFKEFNSKPRTKYDTLNKGYVTCNHFQIKLLSNKEYIKA
jgi:hypothetical protein